MQLPDIQEKIFEIRGQKVMLDFDLASLYEVETRVFNQAVKRNIESFPEDFMFQLTRKELNYLISQIVTSSSQNNRNQSLAKSKKDKNSRVHGGIRKLPYAFTEHGVTMLASVLKSEKARKMNIAIVRAFIALRKFATHYKGLLEQMNELREKIGNHDAQLNQIYDALENMLDKKMEDEEKLIAWENRELIGFKNKRIKN